MVLFLFAVKLLPDKDHTLPVYDRLFGPFKNLIQFIPVADGLQFLNVAGINNIFLHAVEFVKDCKSITQTITGSKLDKKK
jgi:hypothetical protein